MLQLATHPLTLLANLYSKFPSKGGGNSSLGDFHSRLESITKGTHASTVAPRNFYDLTNRLVDYVRLGDLRPLSRIGKILPPDAIPPSRAAEMVPRLHLRDHVHRDRVQLRHHLRPDLHLQSMS